MLPDWQGTPRAVTNEARWQDRLTELTGYLAPGQDWPRHKKVSVYSLAAQPQGLVPVQSEPVYDGVNAVRAEPPGLVRVLHDRILNRERGTTGVVTIDDGKNLRHLRRVITYLR